MDKFGCRANQVARRNVLRILRKLWVWDVQHVKDYSHFWQSWRSRISNYSGWGIFNGHLSGSGKSTLLNIFNSANMKGQSFWFRYSDYQNSKHPASWKLGFRFNCWILPCQLETISSCLGVLSRHRNDAKIGHYLYWIKVNKLQRRFPYEISGGQKQQVAVARAYHWTGILWQMSQLEHWVKIIGSLFGSLMITIGSNYSDVDPLDISSQPGQAGALYQDGILCNQIFRAIRQNARCSRRFLMLWLSWQVRWVIMFKPWN